MSIFFHCGRANMGFTPHKKEDIQKILDMFKTKEDRVQFARECIGLLQENGRWNDSYQKETEYALEHDEFWLEFSEKDELHLTDNIDRSVDPHTRYLSVKDRLDERGVLFN